MSESQKLKALETRISQLELENKALHRREQHSQVEFVKRWQNLIHSSDFDRQVLAGIQGELAQAVGAKYCNLSVYDKAREFWHTKISCPLSGVGFNTEDYVRESEFPFGFDLLKKGKPFVYDDVAEIPSAADTETYLSKYKQRSAFSIPILHEGKLKAFLDLSNGLSTLTATPQKIELASVAAPIIYQGWMELMTRQVTAWVNGLEQQTASCENFSDLEDALRKACSFLGVDGSYFYLCEKYSDNINLSSAFSYPSLHSSHKSENNLQNDVFPWAFSRFMRGESILVDSVDQLPVEASAEKKLMVELQQYSALMIPCMKGGEPVAVMDFHTVGDYHCWNDQEVYFVKLFTGWIYAAYKNISHKELKQESKETLKQVIKHSKVGFVLFNKDFSEAFYSENTSALIGYPPAGDISVEFVAQVIYWDPRTSEQHIAHFSPAFEGDGLLSEVIKVRHVDGNPRWFSCNYQPYSYSLDGSIDFSLGTYSEVTELILRQEALDAARLEADAANLAKGEFLARMSHEIRTPMNAIMGMAHLLKDTTLEEGQLEKVDDIDLAAHNLSVIINDILDFSKIEAGKLRIKETVFDLSKLIEQVSHISSYHSDGESVAITLDVAKGVPQYIETDALRLNQVLTNLLSNAIKFSNGKSVTLSISREPLTLQSGGQYGLNFKVVDQGVGLRGDEIEYIFSPFTQADGSVSRQYGGTGLGLAIVKRLVTLLGGEISVTSQLGRGSCFSFTLMLNAVTAGSSDKQPSADDVESLSMSADLCGGDKVYDLTGLRVLLVEDNIVNQKVAQGFLSKQNVIVSIANDGQEAIDMVKANADAFDAVLMDIEMPRVDGYQAVKVLRGELKFNLPIIAMTAHAMSGDREKCLAAGMNDHIKKPIKPNVLYSSLGEFCLTS